MIRARHLTFIPALFIAANALFAQAPEAAYRVEITPTVVELEVGDSLTISARVLDAGGNAVDPDRLVFVSSARRAAEVDQDGRVLAIAPGHFTVTAIAFVRDQTARGEVPVFIPDPPLAEIQISSRSERLYVGASEPQYIAIMDRSGAARHDVDVSWSTGDPSIATVDRFGIITARKPGTVIVTASAPPVSANRRYEVTANPITSFHLEADTDSARTGDVIHFKGVARDREERLVDDVTVTYSVSPVRGYQVRSNVTLPAWRADTIQDAPVASLPRAEIDDRGEFVAETPGTYVVLANAPGHAARRTVTITARDVSRRVEFLGQGAVRDVRTSDFWVWEGVDGRDYAVTGTHTANGAAYFWDVTDPTQPDLVDSVVVDGRTINDVKVSEDGRVAVISREGASNRRNGIVILDVTNPRDVQQLSVFDDQLTGGVHNHFIYDDHVYVINNIRRFDVINIEDPRKPYRVAVFELDTPGHVVHDIWVIDGVAVVSYLFDGVLLVDVGNGVAGGSPSNPVQFASYKYPVAVTGDVAMAVPTHAAFPYHSPTGKFYVFVGDEAFRSMERGKPTEGVGYIHVIDFTDVENPAEVARFEVPEAGSHNFWVLGDTLYAGFFNGGLRVIDISGELKGDLYAQGREIARFVPQDPEGFTANSAFTWGAQPHKGNIFFADGNSGLWIVRLQRRETLIP